MEFRCRLGTPAGEVIEGVYVADTEAGLRRELEEKGLYVLSLRRRTGLALGLSALSGTRKAKVKQQEFLVFNQELATLLKAGMPLVQSLDILRQRVANPGFRGVLDDVHEKVKAGASLSDAFANHRALFPAVYPASLMAGERSGNLEVVIRRYVGYEKIVGAVRRRTIAALIYPLILVVMMLLLVGIVVLKVIPAFSAFYANFDRPLPALTRGILWVSTGMATNFWLIAPISVAVVLVVLAWARRAEHRTQVERLLLKLPWAGGAIAKFSTSQAARTLATLLGGGLPLVNGLEITARSLSSRHFAEEFGEVRTRVQEGMGFAAAMAERGSFPDVAVKMVEVGESTGALQEMLNSLADFYDEEIETEVDRFTKLIEPALLVFMGVIIAVVVLALYMPLFELSSVAGA
jgi:type IV pilus assembly protein PilC